MRGRLTLIITLSLASVSLCLPASARMLQFGDEKSARKQVGDRVLKLLETSDFAIGQYAKKNDQVDRNSKNPFGSDTTYHSYTWSYCMKWVSTQTCERWLDPYVPLHGVEGGGDQSPLEGAMAEVWKGLKQDMVDGDAAGGGDVQFGMWSVRAKQGKSILRKDDVVRAQTLDPEALADWRLLPEVEQKAKEIGDKTAENAIRGMVVAQDGEQEQTMPSLVDLRAGAASLTRAMRNRMLASIGEARASQPGIEFELGEDRPTCDAYLADYKNYEDKAETPGAIPLPLRDRETVINMDVKKRYELCKQVTEAQIYQINPDVQGESLGLGSPENERIDAALNRINVAMIDQVGLDPSSQPKPADVQIKKSDYTQEIADYEEGGAEYTDRGLTNADQIKLYNNNLQQAAINMRAMVERAPESIPDTTGRILASQIEIGSKRLDQINGLTDQMKDELRETEVVDTALFTTTGVRTSDPDDESIELAPSQLTITTLGGGN